MRLGFELQIPLVRVLTVVVFKGPLDVDWVCVMALNEARRLSRRFCVRC